MVVQPLLYTDYTLWVYPKYLVDGVPYFKVKVMKDNQELEIIFPECKILINTFSSEETKEICDLLKADIGSLAYWASPVYTGVA